MIESLLLWLLWRRHRPEPGGDEDPEEADQDRDWRIPGLVDESN